MVVVVFCLVWFVFVICLWVLEFFCLFLVFCESGEVVLLLSAGTIVSGVIYLPHTLTRYVVPCPKEFTSLKPARQL